MNKPFYNQENIDSYVANKMSAGDKALFENELAKDPLLSNEINLQKDIVESLKTFRKAELKARLNNIEVGIGSSYTGMKVAASVILASLLSFGGYYYFSGNENSNNKETIALSSKNKVVDADNIVEKNNGSSPLTEKKEFITGEENKTTVVKKDVVIKKKITNKEIMGTGSAIETKEDKSLSIVNSPDIKDKFEDNEKFQSENGVQMPKGDVGQTTDQYKIDNLHVEVKKSKKQFHYQYYNNKLFLFGNFDSSPYEIFELNSRKDKELYLYYNNEFYGLKQGQTKITALQVIKDKDKIEALEALRNK